MSSNTWLKPHGTILFQGDSITDAGRTAGVGELGNGYPYLLATRLWAQFPGHNLTVVNRGISGNRSRDLVKRWDEDALELQPDLISILIGINDTWRYFDRNDKTTAGQFHQAYHSILSKTRDRLPQTMLVLCE